MRGYTRFTSEHGDAAAAELAVRFAQHVRAAVTGHYGRLIELRGDEALGVFTSARQALRAATELQARVGEETPAAPSLAMKIGIGLDAGEAVPVEGGYRGAALNLAARLCSLAGGGEVFASEGVAHLAGKIDGLAYVDRGLVRLKGLDGPVRVMQVALDHAVPELPPLQPMARPSNLPAESTPFVGRQREAETIKNPNNVPHFDHLRQGLKPLEIVQPDGVSFEIDGNEVRWQNWRFRVGWTAREGLVLYQIGYEERGKLRPVCYRASITDLFVPYGDPSPTHRRKNAFDAGEYGLGMLANSLELGCDCLGEIRYLDATMVGGDGQPWTIKNAICMHEEDFGILWKHYDMRTGNNEMRRARRFVVSFISTVANYEYGFYWYFYQDGTIEFESMLTGIISTGALQPGETPRHGTLVAPQLYGPHHQHYFAARMDVMVDGENNSVYEVESQSEPMSSENPIGNAWVNRETLLARESQAQRIVSPLTARSWKIVNPAVKNELGQNTAYRLVPGENVLPFLSPDAPILKRCGFITKHLWVTRYDPNERYAAGDYINQHPGGAGVPQYVYQNRDIENTDIVVWYTCGVHHTVRPEDWPVMPVARIGFHLTPFGFFVGNPALDLPPME